MTLSHFSRYLLTLGHFQTLRNVVVSHADLPNLYYCRGVALRFRCDLFASFISGSLVAWTNYPSPWYGQVLVSCSSLTHSSSRTSCRWILRNLALNWPIMALIVSLIFACRLFIIMNLKNAVFSNEGQQGF